MASKITMTQIAHNHDVHVDRPPHVDETARAAMGLDGDPSMLSSADLHAFEKQIRASAPAAPCQPWEPCALNQRRQKGQLRDVALLCTALDKPDELAQKCRDVGSFDALVATLSLDTFLTLDADAQHELAIRAAGASTKAQRRFVELLGRAVATVDEPKEREALLALYLLLPGSAFSGKRTRLPSTQMPAHRVSNIVDHVVASGDHAAMRNFFHGHQLSPRDSVVLVRGLLRGWTDSADERAILEHLGGVEHFAAVVHRLSPEDLEALQSDVDNHFFSGRDRYGNYYPRDNYKALQNLVRAAVKQSHGLTLEERMRLFDVFLAE